MKSLNLFVDAHVFSDPYQGSRTYLSGLYKELTSMTNGVNYYFGVDDPDTVPHDLKNRDNVKLVRYFTRNKYIRLSVNIPFLIKKYKIDIAHFQYVVPLIKLSEEIVTIHDLLFLDYPELFPFSYRQKNRFLFRISAKRADKILTVSEYSRDRISEHFKIPKNKITVTPGAIHDIYLSGESNSIDIKSKYGLKKFLLFVGRIEPRKNHIMLLRAYNELELNKKGYSLVMIGSRSVRSPEFEKYLKDLPPEVRNSVRIFDNIPPEEVGIFYRECRMFVYPSLAEGFGLPPLEAYAAGASVICSNTTAMADFKFLGRRLFNPDSLQELKERIMTYIDCPGEKEPGAINQIKHIYNWKRSAEILKEILLADS